METVKVDLLVIGDMMTSSYMACELEAHIIGAGNITEITPSNIPDFHFEDYGGYEPTHWMRKPKLNTEI